MNINAISNTSTADSNTNTDSTSSAAATTFTAQTSSSLLDKETRSIVLALEDAQGRTIGSVALEIRTLCRQDGHPNSSPLTHTHTSTHASSSSPRRMSAMSANSTGYGNANNANNTNNASNTSNSNNSNNGNYENNGNDGSTANSGSNSGNSGISGSIDRDRDRDRNGSFVQMDKRERRVSIADPPVSSSNHNHYNHDNHDNHDPHNPHNPHDLSHVATNPEQRVTRRRFFYTVTADSYCHFFTANALKIRELVAEYQVQVSLSYSILCTLYSILYTLYSRLMASCAIWSAALVSSGVAQSYSIIPLAII